MGNRHGANFAIASTVFFAFEGCQLAFQSRAEATRTSGQGGGASSGAISIDPISGPIEKISADTFRVAFQKETVLQTNTRNFELVFAATHPGDKDYKAAVQQAHMFIPARNTQGKDQHISFSSIPDQKIGTKSLKLTAISDAGEPVHYTVLEGPAEVRGGDTLVFTTIPPQSRFPVKVTVVAWQYGRSIEPKWKTAQPVEQTFYLTKAQ